MNAQLGKKEAATFAEVLGQLQYLASHTRIDITPVVSVLAPHLLTPTEGDQIMLARCLHYLKANPSMPLVFKADSNFTITAEADASWNLHPNGKSQMANAIYLGNALVHFKSKIIPQVMQAVSDAETISQVYAVNKALQIRNLLLELKIPTSVKIKCLQDNKAAIITASNNKYGGKASWMKPPYYFLRETAAEVFSSVCVDAHKINDR